MPSAADVKIVAVLLSENEVPRAVHLDDDGAPLRMAVDGANYTDAGAGDWLGFYDWLRAVDGEIIGVRQYLDNPRVFPWERRLLGVETSGMENGVLCIFFGARREFEEDRSCDQSFGGNRLLLGARGVALTFVRPNGAL